METVPQSQFYGFDRFVSENDLSQSWIATERQSGRKCFLKIPSRSGIISPNTIREILSKSFLCQKNIESGQILCAHTKRLEKGNILIAYPYIDTAQWSPLTSEVFLRDFETIFPQACLIVDFIHLLGYVHCDLKMENLVVNRDHGVPRAMMIDLDFLREEGRSLDAKIIGTPTLIAPEVMTNEAFTSKSDNYSIGKSLNLSK